MIGPLNVAAKYVDRISKGDIPEKITDSYNGDFNEIKNNINDCIDAVNALVSDTHLLVEAAVEGKMDTRVDASHHGGDFGTIVQGVNATLDAIMEPLSESINVLEKMAMNDYNSKMEGHYQGIFAETAQEVNAVRERLISAVETNIHIAAGDFAEDLKKFKEIGKRSEEDRLVPSFIMSMENINRLVSDARMMADAAIDGRLDVRIDATQHQGEYRIVAEGINNTLDAVIGPVKVVNEFMDKVARGDNLQLITEEYKGEFNLIKNNMNNCVNVIHSILDETSRLTQAACEGRLDVRCDDAQLYNNLQKNISMADTYLGRYYGNIAYQDGALVDKNGKKFAGDTQMVDALTAEAGGVATIFAKSGDDFVRIATNIINDKGERAVGTMLGKSSLAYSSISQGKNYTGPATILNKPYLTAYNPLFDKNRQVIGVLFVGLPQIQGSWNQLVMGINETLDAVVGPLNMAAEYVERIGKGDIPEKITDSYNGDFNDLKINLNACIDGLGGLVESSNVLKRMALNDQTHKVEGQYQGIFAETAQSINDVRSRLLVITNTLNNIASGDFKNLIEYKEIGGRSEEDQIVPAFIVMMENILKLVGDAGMMAEASVAGRLDARIDITQHQGEYREVAEGINNTLEALTSALTLSEEYIERLAEGNTPPRITASYNGDFNKIKDNLNTLIDSLSIMVEEVGVAINAGVEGKLDQRANTDRAKGVYHKILAGVNATLDAVVVGPPQHDRRIYRADR